MATVFSGAMRAGGVAFAPMLLSIFAIAAIEIPAAVILSRTIGLDGVWAAYPIVFSAMFILQLGYYMLVWRRRPLRRMVTRASRAFPRYYDRHNTVDALPALRHNAPKYRGECREFKSAIPVRFRQPNAFLSHEAIPAIEKRTA